MIDTHSPGIFGRGSCAQHCEVLGVGMLKFGLCRLRRLAMSYAEEREGLEVGFMSNIGRVFKGRYLCSGLFLKVQNVAAFCSLIV